MNPSCFAAPSSSAIEPPWITELKTYIATAAPAERRTLLDSIVATAVELNLEPANLKLLGEVFSLLGVDTTDAYCRMHVLAGSLASVTSEPIAVRRASPAPTVPISSPSTASPVVVDMRVVQAKQAESAQAAVLLRSIFAEEEPIAATTASPRAHEPRGDLQNVKNLDARHSAFVRLLAKKSSWPRGELHTLAAEVGLLLDGALEVVNEAALDTCGVPLADGNDPVLIDNDIVKELLA